MISIIVPMYNVEKYIERCIQSILIQSYSNFEVIIVNDGSTDKSEYVVNKFSLKDSRIRMFSQNNRGVSSARNTGLNVARGDYICFVDADDFLCEDYLKILYDNIKKYNADISICNWTREMIIRERKLISQPETWTRDEAFFKLFKYKKIDGSVACKLYKKKIVSNLQFDEKIKLGEDQIFFIQSLEKSDKVVYQNIDAYVYFYRASSAMNTKIDQRYWDAVYRAEWIAKKAEEYSHLSGLFKQEEISIYLYLIIINCQNSSEIGAEISNFVYQRIKASSTWEYRKYSRMDDFGKYILIKYFPKIAKKLAKVKKMMTGVQVKSYYII